jgi:hypothetical protein
MGDATMPQERLMVVGVQSPRFNADDLPVRGFVGPSERAPERTAERTVERTVVATGRGPR